MNVVIENKLPHREGIKSGNSHSNMTQFKSNRTNRLTYRSSSISVYVLGYFATHMQYIVSLSQKK